jgi:hypothetical protein
VIARAVLVLALGLGLFACAEGSDLSAAEDATLVVDPSLLRISAAADDGRVVVAGLDGAMPAAGIFEVVEEGNFEILATGVVSGRGSFAGWLPETSGRPMIRLLTGSASGPLVAVSRPASADLRAPAGHLIFAAALGAAGRIQGMVGAVAGSSRVVVARPATGLVSTGLSDGDGQFALDLEAEAGGAIALFSIGADDPGRLKNWKTASEPLSVGVTENGFAVVLSGARGTETGAVAFAPSGSLPDGADIVITRGETGVPVGSARADADGGFGVCFAGTIVGWDLLFSAAKAGVTRLATHTVPGNQGLVPVLNPSISSSAADGSVSIHGSAPKAVGHVVAVSCQHGARAFAAVGEDGTFEVAVPGDPGDVVGIVGIGVGGQMGIAQFLFGGTQSEVPLPLPGPDASLLGISAWTDGEVLVVGDSDRVGGAAMPGGRVEIRVPPAAPHIASSSLDGEFGATVAVTVPNTAVEVLQVAGPFRSEPVSLEVKPLTDASPSPFAPGLLSVEATGDVIRVQLQGVDTPGSLAAVNLDRGHASFDPPTPLLLTGAEVFLTGKVGDEIGVMRVSDDGVTGLMTTRVAGELDLPYVVSGPGSIGCIVGLSGWDEGAEIVHVDSEPAGIGSTVDGEAWTGVLSTGWTGGAVEVRSGSRIASRVVPGSLALDVSQLELVVTPQGPTLSSGSTLLGPAHRLALITTDGVGILLRPPQAAPWTLPLPIQPGAVAWVFAVDPASGAASACVQLAVDVDVDGPPGIDAVTPALLVVGNSYKVTGTNLLGGLVSIGAWSQPVASNDGTTLIGTVNQDTPTGPQVIRILTLGGEVESGVVVAAAPTIDSVDPLPLVSGAAGTISGAAFTETPTVTLNNQPVVVVSVSPELIEFEVPSLGGGFYPLSVSTVVDTATVTVEVECGPPVITFVPPQGFPGEALAITGKGLLSPNVTLNSIAQEVVAATGTQLQLGTQLQFMVHPTTPAGDATLVISTDCGQTQGFITIATDKPVIDEIVPALAIRDLPLNIYGDHLAGATVTFGGVGQALAVDSKKGLSFDVDDSTPLGSQPLVVTTAGGTTQLSVTVIAPPVISSVSPPMVTAGNSLDVLGQHLGGAQVSIGGVAAVAVFPTAGLVEVVTSPDTPAGLQTLVLTTPAGEASTQITVLAPPQILSVDPNPANPGKLLTILGKNFVNPTLEIAGMAHSPVVISPATLEVMVSSSVPVGAQPVTVTSNGGTDTLLVTFVTAPTIADVQPVPLTIGGIFNVSGADFLASATEVRIGGTVQWVNASTSSLITGQVLVGTPVGAQTLTVESTSGTAEFAVTVIGPPQITGFNPNPVLVGQDITIIGLSLSNADVSLAGVTLNQTASSDTQIVVWIPTDTVPGDHTLILTTPAGVDSTTVTVQTLPPQITEVAPNPVQPGETVTISGSNLLGATATLGGASVGIQSNTLDTIVGQIHPNTPLGAQTVAVTTLAGVAQVTVQVGEPPPSLPPVIDSISPDGAPVGESLTISGEHLLGGVVLLGDQQQTILSNDGGALVFVIGDLTPGEYTLTIITTAGETTHTVSVFPPAPTLLTAAPQPITPGELLTVTGTHLGLFTSVTLGGTTQSVFATVSDDSLVFLVASGTPDGAAMPLVVTTDGGSAELSVHVAPEPFVPPELFDIQPSTVQPGDTILISGFGLNGATWTIDGVPHDPQPGSGDFVVNLTVSESMLAGTRAVTATEEDAVSSANIFVQPGPPNADLIFISAVSESYEAAVVGLPGAVAPGAALEVTVDGSPVFATANAEGGFGVLLDTVAATFVIGVGQVVEGVPSAQITQILAAAQPTSPPMPHQFLMRIERQGDDVMVYGPPPTFGAADTLVLALSADSVAGATAAELHADPTTGLFLPGAGVGFEPVVVFSVGPDGAASTAVLGFAVEYDPPILSSAVSGSTICLGALAGTISGDLTLGLVYGNDAPVPLTSLDSATTASGQLSAATLLKASAGAGPYFWTVEADQSVELLVSATPAPPLPMESVTLVPTASGLEVTVVGLDPADLLMVSLDNGHSAAAFAQNGQATATLDDTAATELRTWTISLSGSGTSGCRILSLD